MKHIKLILLFVLAYAMCSCGAKNASADEDETGRIENETLTSDSDSDTDVITQDYSNMIKKVYENFVFATEDDSDVYNHPERYFTANALKKLQDSYEYDCEDNNCYAFYELRTNEQDSKPGTSEESKIISIENVEDDWYVVKYLDMGWSGITRIKIADGKIDDFKRSF